MTDSYQAIYDAVRSRISNGDIGRAVENVIREANVSHYFWQAGLSIEAAASQHERPSAVYRPELYPDGDKWCALYGKDLMEGVVGFGDTPQEAMSNFDVNWHNEHTPDARRNAEGKS